MSDTPRTDALLLEINEGREYETEGPVASLCHTLEREVDIAKKENEELMAFAQRVADSDPLRDFVNGDAFRAEARRFIVRAKEIG